MRRQPMRRWRWRIAGRRQAAAARLSATVGLEITIPVSPHPGIGSDLLAFATTPSHTGFDQVHVRARRVRVDLGAAQIAETSVRAD
jgi:hypothetical protein